MAFNNSVHGNSRVGGEGHAYDTPYAKMLEMRKDIQDLRGMLQAEQQQRAAEVTELRQEVQILRSALKQETNNRDAVVHRLMRDLAPANKSKEFDELRTQLKHQVAKLEVDLEDEVRDRKASEQLRDTREATRCTDVHGTMTALSLQFEDHKSFVTGLKKDNSDSIGKCAHDIQLLSGGLQRVTQSWLATPIASLKTGGGTNGCRAQTPQN